MAFGAVEATASEATAMLRALLRPALAPGLAARPPGGTASHADQAALATGELVDVLGRARGALLRLAEVARTLDASSGMSVFSAAIVRSSDPGAVRGRVLAGLDLARHPAGADWRIRVSRLAAAQKNAGTGVPSGGVGALTAGPHVVRIVQAGTSSDVRFTVHGGETNAQALARFAAAVNDAAGLGVRASVIGDEAADMSRLVLTARATGATQAFAVTDLDGSAVAEAGVATATTRAANAVYTLDGAVLTAETNVIRIGPDGRVEITLAGLTADTVGVSVAANVARIGAAVTALVRSYNAARRFFDAHADLFAGTAAALRSLGSRFRAALGSVGAAPGGGGGLALDDVALGAALRDALPMVRDALGGEAGLAAALAGLAERQLAAAGGGLEPLPGAGYTTHPAMHQGVTASRWPPRLLDAVV